MLPRVLPGLAINMQVLILARYVSASSVSFGELEVAPVQSGHTLRGSAFERQCQKRTVRVRRNTPERVRGGILQEGGDAVDI